MGSTRDIQLIELKDTISELRITIQNQNNMIVLLQKTIEEHNSKEDEKDRLIADLRAQLEFLKQKLFGSTSEAHKVEIEGQLNLFEDPDEVKPSVPVEPEIINVGAHTRERKNKSTYEEMFADLPTREELVDTLTDEENTCAVCGSTMVPIGHEVIRTELEYTPAKLTRVNYIATTYECPKCKDTEDPQFIKDNGEAALIPGSYASSGLAAHVMYAKYVLALPLYRQEKDFEQLGVKISRGTLAHWIIYCAENYFNSVYEYLHKELLKRRYLMADELCKAIHNSSYMYHFIM